MTEPGSEIARDAQSDVRERSAARWLDVFAVFQFVCGLVYLWFAISGIEENVPLYVPALAHILLGWCVWTRRRRFWLPYLVVLINPWVTFVLHRLYPPTSRSGGGPVAFGIPMFAVLLVVLFVLTLLAAYLWEVVMLLILATRAGRLLGPPRPFKLRLAGLLAGSAIIARAVALDFRMFVVLLIPLFCLTLPAAYLWQVVMLVILATRADRMLGPPRPFKLRLAGFLAGSAIIAGAVGMDFRAPLQRESLWRKQHQEEYQSKLTTAAVEAFFLAAEQQDQNALAAAEQGLLRARVLQTARYKLLDGLRHQDPNVRLETVRLYPPGVDKMPGSLTPIEEGALLTIIANQAEKVEIRLAAVAAFMRADERQNMFATLAGLGDEAVFAVPMVSAIADAIGSSSRPHVDGTFDALVFLNNLGPLAKEAEPALLAAAESKDHQVRTAARAALRRVAPITSLDDQTAFERLMKFEEQNHSGANRESFAFLEFRRGEVDDEALGCICRGLERLNVADTVKSLNLSETAVTSDGLVHLRRLPNILHLMLDQTAVDDDGLEYLASLVKLKDLQLGKTQVTDHGLEHLAPLVDLEVLGLDETRVTDDGLAFVRHFPQLRSTNVRGTAVTAAGIANIMNEQLVEGDGVLDSQHSFHLRFNLPVDKELVAQVEHADGLVSQVSAFCQTVRLEDAAAMTRQLHTAGFRPERFRPYRAGGEVRVAILWRLEQVAWRLLFKATAAKIREQDKTLREQGYIPIDVAGYDAGEEAYSAIWIQPRLSEPRRELMVGEDVARIEDSPSWQPLRDQGYAPITWQQFLDSSGRMRHSLIVAPLATWRVSSGDRPSYDSHAAPNMYQCDIGVARGLQSGQPIPEFTGCWRDDPGKETVALVGLDPTKHLESCRDLYQRRYFPVAIGAATVPGDQPIVTASVWEHRRQ